MPPGLPASRAEEPPYLTLALDDGLAPDTAARPGEQDADSGHSLAGAVRRLVTELDPQQEHSLEEAAHPGGGGPWVILVDALDEARDPLEVERHFFSGLLAIPGVRLLVGTRRSTLDALEQPKAHHTDLTDALREEERGRLRVASIHPGRVDTDMQVALQARAGRPYTPEAYLRPESVAAAVKLALDATEDAVIESVAVTTRGPVGGVAL